MLVKGNISVNNILVENTEDIDVPMPVYNLIKYSDNYWKTSGSLQQYWKDIPRDNGDIDFNGANAIDLFNFKAKITG